MELPFTQDAFFALFGQYNAVAAPVALLFYLMAARRADAGVVPATFSEDMIAEGAGSYADYCAHCHGGPGVEPATWSRGMRPEPPHLSEAATEWSSAEIHWIVENGIRMTGMPAFGPDHEAEEILAITAFVSALPGLSADDYSALTGGQGQTGGPTLNGPSGAAE